MKTTIHEFEKMNSYPAFFIKEEQGYSVSFCDFDGLYSQGDTFEEAFFMAKDALQLILDYMAENEETIPEPLKKYSPNNLENADSNQVKVVMIPTNNPASIYGKRYNVT